MEFFNVGLVTGFAAGASTFVILNALMKKFRQPKEVKTEENKPEESEKEDDSPIIPPEYNSREPHKIVFVVRTDVKMDSCVMTSLCCDACIETYNKALVMNPKAVKVWERTGVAKIVVKCPTIELFHEAVMKAEELRIPHSVVEGVLALGPGNVGQIDLVSKNFKLM